MEIYWEQPGRLEFLERNQFAAIHISLNQSEYLKIILKSLGMGFQ